MPTTEIIIVRAVQTCEACPSQWDAWDADGRYWYLRHRHSVGAAWQYDSPDCETWDERPPVLRYEIDWESESTEEIGDGYVSLREFCRRTGLNLALR